MPGVAAGSVINTLSTDSTQISKSGFGSLTPSTLHCASLPPSLPAPFAGMEDSIAALLLTASRMQAGLEEQEVRASELKASAAEKQAALKALHAHLRDVKINEAAERSRLANLNVQLLRARATLSEQDEKEGDQQLIAHEFQQFAESLGEVNNLQREMAALYAAETARLDAHDALLQAQLLTPLSAALSRSQGILGAVNERLAAVRSSVDEQLQCCALDSAEHERALATARSTEASLRAQLRAATSANDAALRQCSDLRCALAYHRSPHAISHLPSHPPFTSQLSALLARQRSSARGWCGRPAGGLPRAGG